MENTDERQEMLPSIAFASTTPPTCKRDTWLRERIGRLSAASTTNNNNTSGGLPLMNTWSYNYKASVTQPQTFICRRCNLSRPMSDYREYVRRDGVNEQWVCVDCLEGRAISSSGAALADANLRILLERAAAYVQICNEGGDWNLIDASPDLSRDLLMAIRTTLGRNEKWDPSQLRREKKI